MKRLFLILLYCGILLCSTFATAQSTSLSPVAKQIFFGTTGSYIDKPLAGGKIYTYAAGTTTPLATYTSQGGGANTNPIILDAAGFANIWLTIGAYYKFVVQDANGVNQYTVDNISTSVSSGSGCLSIGSAGQVLFNNAGACAGDSSFTWDNTAKALTATNFNTSHFNLGNSPIASGLDFSVYGNKTSNYTIPNSFEQMNNPTTTVTSPQIVLLAEGVTYLGNTQAHNGIQTGLDASYSYYGSGAHNGAIYGSISESFNAGPATALLVTGAAGTANCGGTTAGFPVQTPTNNGNCTNLRGGEFFTNNRSSGIVTSATGVFIDPATNTGGGQIQDVYGILISDQTAGTNSNHSLYAGAGLFEVRGLAQFYGNLQSITNMTVGNTAVIPTTLLQVGGFTSALTSGTSQALFSASGQTNGYATVQGTGAQFRADVFPGTAQSLNIGNSIATPIIGSGGSIGTWYGLNVDVAPTTTVRGCQMFIHSGPTTGACVNATSTVNLNFGITGGTLAINPLTTPGDVFIGGSGGLETRLAQGANGTFLGVSGGVLGYYTPSFMTNPMTTAGDIIVGGSSGTPARVAIGTTDQVATVAGGTVAWAIPLKVASLVTTAATTDNVTVTGMTASGHCMLQPTNAAAATDQGLGAVYVSNKTTNQITVTHTATANENFDVMCTAY